MCFSVLFIAAAVVACILLYCRRIDFSQAAAALLLILFLGIVFGSTVFTRNPSKNYRYELELFWSWKAVRRGSREMLKENLLNMVLLFPAGILRPVIFKRKVSWWKGLAMGILISAAIESSQLIFRRGLFEWDDMLHNGIGCMLGCIISSCFIRHIPVGRK